VLLSDRDLKAELASGGLGLTPYDEAMVQPSSVDVRLDRYFRVFANHRYTHIDPSQPQEDLTELVEPDGDEPFVLHPGEFVLASTFEVITLGDHLASRLEGKSSLGRLGAACSSWAAPSCPRTTAASGGSGCSPTPPRASSTRASRAT
jgi:dCTP deaminase